ncbi:autotransporter outer membrane beta-barrel domain-containing protein [Yersinia vastinensis]|uniref:autotransporter outer membrane beta-barrel domain-containing protein n=1 Tax=Yersinia vastinensis TaxID=2890318 RepID=UPI0011A98502|nr:autotransporter outer membrane beta-barrel domain-containing protein [Yersinia vastinensis]
MKYKFSCIAFAIASAISPALAYADISVSGSVSPGNPTTPSWVIPDFTPLIVGDGADGTLTASNGGTLILGNNRFDVGMSGSTGRVEIIGPGSAVLGSDSGVFELGNNSGHGILRILDGGGVAIGHAHVGDFSGTGDLEVSGVGSHLNLINYISIAEGIGSVGTMKIADGGVVTNGGFGGFNDVGGYIGASDTAVGRVEVTGPGSIWSSHGSDNSTHRGLSVGWLGYGELTINNAGTVNVDNGINIAAHAGSTGVLNIGSAANDAATSAGYINTPRITMGLGDSSIVFNHTDSNYELNSVIDGDGKVEIVNGTTILNGNNIYSGSTTVYHGILKAGAGNTFSAASDYIIDSAGQLDLAGFSQTLNSLNNGGTVSLNGAPGTVLTISGDYIGNDGLINFNSVLNDDNSATDKLVVNGNTSGTTRVGVTNLGGSGAETLNGIELIQVNGLSDGDFIKQGRIVAGAYDYSLTRGIGTNVSNWYLTSAAIPADPADPLPMVERPEAGSYTANLAAANNMFVTSLNDRLGETQYIDALTGEHKMTSLWLRNEGGHNRSRDTDGQLNTQANRYVMQLGGDIAQWSSNATDRFHLGVMAGYGNSKSTTVSQVTGYNSKGSTDGYSAGVYGTWYANEADKSGLYVDGWAHYSWFNNTVNGQGLVTEEYKSKGVTASIESGYTFKVGENAAKNAVYFIQPKAQVTRMGVKADDHKEANGTYVSGKGDGNIQTRLGVKAFMNGYSDQDKGKDRVFQPFVETNWIHNTKDFGTTMDGITVKQDGAANIAELKLGVEGQINKKVNVWGNVSQQVGNKGYSDTAVMLGVKYNF